MTNIRMVRNQPFVRMESALKLWKFDCKKKTIFNGNIICDKEEIIPASDKGDGSESTEEHEPRPLIAQNPKSLKTVRNSLTVFRNGLK